MKIVTKVKLISNKPIETDSKVYFDLLDSILNVVCCENEVDVYDVKNKRRFEELMIARREYCYLACKLTQLSESNPYKNTTVKIGAKINIDHATVLYHKNKVECWLNIKGYLLKEKFEIIEQKLIK